MLEFGMICDKKLLAHLKSGEKSTVFSHLQHLQDISHFLKKFKSVTIHQQLSKLNTYNLLQKNRRSQSETQAIEFTDLLFF